MIKWFRGGVILVHDYFAENFKGPQQAVEEFMTDKKEDGIGAYPIGDGISILITGF